MSMLVSRQWCIFSWIIESIRSMSIQTSCLYSRIINDAMNRNCRLIWFMYIIYYSRCLCYCLCLCRSVYFPYSFSLPLPLYFCVSFSLSLLSRCRSFFLLKFLRQKLSRSEGDSNPQPSDSCRMLWPFELSGSDSLLSHLFKYWLWWYRYICSKINIWNINCAGQQH